MFVLPFSTARQIEKFLSKKRPFYIHLRPGMADPNGLFNPGVVTFGYFYNFEKRGIEFSIAYCSPDENFCRADSHGKVGYNFINNQSRGFISYEPDGDRAPRRSDMVRVIAKVYNGMSRGDKRKHFQAPGWALTYERRCGSWFGNQE